MAMNLETPVTAQTANRWYPLPKTPRSSYKSFPIPQSILRASLGESSYLFKSQIIDSDGVRAAAILPHDVPFSHLMQTPWSMSFRGPEWRMIIVSVLDPMKWIELARSSGCQAWLKSHNRTYVYSWEQMRPELDAHGMAIRSPNPGLRPDGTKKTSPLTGIQKKNYDKEEILDQLRENILTQKQIADKHKISRVTVMAISKEAGIVKRGNRHGQSLINTKLKEHYE